MSAAKVPAMQTSAMNAQRGFTLVEILVVIVLVSIVSIGSFALLDTFNSTDRALEFRAEELRRFSMAMYRIDDDLRQLTARPVKNGYNGYEPALRGDTDELEFTRLGAANLIREPRGELQRLSYGIGYAEDSESDSRSGALDDEDEGALLLRSRWRVLDRGPDSEPVAEPLLAGVDDLQLRYYDEESGTWLDQWPPVTSLNSGTEANTALPRAIEFVLLTRRGGELRRVFTLPKVAASASGGIPGGGGGDGSGNRGEDGGNGDDNDGERREEGSR